MKNDRHTRKNDIKTKYRETLKNIEDSIEKTSEEEKIKNKQEEKEAMNSKNLFLTALAILFLLIGVIFTCVFLTEIGVLPKLMLI